MKEKEIIEEKKDVVIIELDIDDHKIFKYLAPI